MIPENSETNPPAAAPPEVGGKSAWRFDWRIAGGSLLAIVVLVIWRATVSHAKPTSPTLQALSVPVARVTRENVFNEVKMTAEFRPFLQVELHAKVSGYVEEITVDIGDKVNAGQLLAKLEVPELGNELDRAQAAKKRAEADYQDAHLIYTRLKGVDEQHPNLVAQQELDTAASRDHSTEAAIAGAKAEVERYQTMLAYTRITAPFKGIITKRYADPGSLIQAGTASDTQSMPLVRLSDNYRLRLDFPVSVRYVKDIVLGDEIDIRVDSLEGELFKGRIARCSSKVDEDTRTMIVEIEVPNPDLRLVPGMYATVVLRIQRHPQALTIPTEAISADKTNTVFVVNKNQQVEERPVKLGVETPARWEVLSGVSEGELVMTGSWTKVKPGQKVEGQLTPSMSLP